MDSDKLRIEPMPDTIQIRGELLPDPSQCRFHVDRPLIDDGWTVGLAREDEWSGSGLAESLFTLDGIEFIQVNETSVVVTKSTPGAWTELAAEVVPVIREALLSDTPPISEALVNEVKSAPTDSIADTVEQLFELHINPALASHGGFVRLVKVEERDVFLEMGGGCQGCAASQATLRQGIESAIRRVVPQVREVIDVTDHESGSNPYYT
jgi:Fe-S cluster biogenesis protein NfuA